MTIKHTHPDYAGKTERMERLTALKRSCREALAQKTAPANRSV